MIVTCPECSARYKLDEDKVSDRGAKITCPRCRHVFVVYREDEDTEESTNSPLDSVSPDGLGPKRRDASNLDFRKVGISSWKVRVKIGLVYDFSDIKTLRKYIRDGRVTADDVISHNAKTWVTIGDIPDLDTYFFEVYERCETERLQDDSIVPRERVDDEDSNVGIGGLGGQLAEQALAQATAEAEADLAAARSAEPSRPARPQGRQFVDPFAALKDKQRERIQNRRRGGGQAAPKKKKKAVDPPRIAIAALVLILMGGSAWWWSSQQSSAKPITQGFNDGQGVRSPVASGNAKKELENDIRAMMKEIEKEREKEDLEEESKGGIPEGAKPVIPQGAVPVTPPGMNQPGQNASVVQDQDFVATCLAAGGRADWTGAVASCGQAWQESGNADVAFFYGVSLYKKGQPDRAKQPLEAVSGVQCEANLYLGRIYGGQGDIAGANGAYVAYKECNPGGAAIADREMKDLTGG